MKYFKILMIMLTIGFITPSYGQKLSTKEDNIVFLLRQQEHFTQAVKTIGALKEMNVSKIKPSKVVIILCGEMLKNISSEEMSKQLEIACAQGITVYARGLSLNKLGISKESLPSNFNMLITALSRAWNCKGKGIYPLNFKRFLD